MRMPEVNVEELAAWCERRGIDPARHVAERPETWRTGKGIHYRLRLPTDDPCKRLYDEVIAPLDDPMPPMYKFTRCGS